jgi:hypothetical protein
MSAISRIRPSKRLTPNFIVRWRGLSLLAEGPSRLSRGPASYRLIRCSSISDRSESRLTRRSRREAWLRKAVVATARCDVVFFDPDNGLETASVAPDTPKSGKYVFWEELLPFWRRGQSLVIYHHLNRTASVNKQATILKEKFAAKFADAGSIRHFLFRRGSCRHFWLVAQREHDAQLRAFIERVAQSAWHEYFEVG